MAPPFDFLTASGLPYSLVNPLQNPNPLIPLLSGAHSQRRRGNKGGRAGRRSISTVMSLKAKSSSRYAILGAGFAGLSVAWHLLKHSQKGSHVCVDIFDENGIGGGASGVAGGLLHPYSPKAKLLWKGAEFWKECLELVDVAEEANSAQRSEESKGCIDGSIILRRYFLHHQRILGAAIRVFRAKELLNLYCYTKHNYTKCLNGVMWNNNYVTTTHPLSKGIFYLTKHYFRGILRPATSVKNVEFLMKNALSCLESCVLETLDEKAAQSLIPGLCAPFDLAIYMPLAMSIHPKRYLQALFSACQNLANNESKLQGKERIINLNMQHVSNLQQLSGEYDSVIVCLGARVNTLPELSGKLPLRTCRGIVADLHLPTTASGEYADQSPSILSDAWLAFQGPRHVYMGSTWDWNSKNHDQNVSKEEASRATEELLSKASVFYPEITKWSFVGAKAGLRAMPPLTDNGSLPLLGCLNDLIGDKSDCMFWLVGGLGARGLLYHGLVGKLTSQAVISCEESVIPFEFIDWKRKTPFIVN